MPSGTTTKRRRVRTFIAPWTPEREAAQVAAEQREVGYPETCLKDNTDLVPASRFPEPIAPERCLTFPDPFNVPKGGPYSEFIMPDGSKRRGAYDRARVGLYTSADIESIFRDPAKTPDADTLKRAATLALMTHLSKLWMSGKAPGPERVRVISRIKVLEHEVLDALGVAP